MHVARSLVLWLVTCLALILCGCGGGDEVAVGPLTISAQPVDTSVMTGSAAVFSVTAPSATAYRWQISTDAGVVWIDIAGATTSTYTADVSALSGTRYRVVVSGPGGASVTSSVVTLTVTPLTVAPAITIQPSDAVVTAGQNASFSVTAMGTAPVYQWQSSSNAGVTYAPVAGATGATYALMPAMLADNTTRFRVSVSNSAGMVTSNAAVLTVNAIPEAPMFTSQPMAMGVIAPAAATFTAVAVGTPAPTLQWQLSTNAGVAWSDIAGASGDTYTTPPTSTAQSGNQYRAIATNSSASVSSNAAVLTVSAVPVAPAFTLQPAAVSVTTPATATFTVAATGAPAPTLQWQMSSDGGASYANINGATASGFTTAPTAVSDDGKKFRAVASNASGSLNSSPATLTVAAVASNSVGPAGGTLSFLGGAVRMVFPAGAVSAPTTIDVQPATLAQPRYPAPVTGTLYDFGPTGTRFAVPVRVTIRYDATQLPAGSDPLTMQIAKSTADGWNALVTTVDPVAHTMAADLNGFSSYGGVPGLASFGYGSFSGLAVRFLDWPGVRNTKVVTDPAGAVYFGAVKPTSFGGPDPIDQGPFVARLNSNLSVQWVRTLPNAVAVGEFILRVDQQGNTYAAYADDSVFPALIRLISFNPAGALRSGFPVSWSSSQSGEPRGMSIDPIGNVHVFCTEADIVSGQRERLQRGSYTVVRGGDGSFATPTQQFSLVPAPGAYSATGWDMGLDYAGNVFFTSTWQSNGVPGYGGNVLSFHADTLAPRAGFPKPLTQPSFISSAINAVVRNPLTIVPILNYTLQGGNEVAAFNGLSGNAQAGFPAPLSGGDIAGAAYSVVDSSGNIWVLGQASPPGAIRKVWIGGINSAGQTRAGFPRVFGGGTNTFDNGEGIAGDPGGTFYVSGTQSVVPDPDGTTGRVFIARMPGL